MALPFPIRLKRAQCVPLTRLRNDGNKRRTSIQELEKREIERKKKEIRDMPH